MTSLPLISVITVVRNGESTLEQTIQSVLSQEYESVEHVIVDGASTDGTLDILRAYAGRVRWLSEPDRGIYEAMNKGLALAKGQWIHFLGADDRLAGPETLARVVPCLDDRLSLVFGRVRYPDGRVVKSGLGPRTMLRNTVHHQGTLYNARLFDSWRYDCSFNIVADYELNLILYLTGRPFARVDEIIAYCGDLGVSLSQWKKAVAETNAVRRKHVGATSNALLAFFREIELAGARLLTLWQRRKES